MPLTRVNVFFTPPPPGHLRGRTTLVIDTLRATTTLVTLVANDAAAVYPTPSDAEAFALAKTLPGSHLCGEREGRRVPGFEFGNSPLELLDAGIAGKTFVQSTSNGTRALTISPGRRTETPAPGRRTQTQAPGRRRKTPAPTRPPITPSSPASATERPPSRPPSRRLPTPATPTPAPTTPAPPSPESRSSAPASASPPAPPSRTASPPAPASTPSSTPLPPDQLFLESGARLALRIFDAYGRDPARAFADSPTPTSSAASATPATSTSPPNSTPIPPSPRHRDAEGRIVVRR